MNLQTNRDKTLEDLHKRDKAIIDWVIEAVEEELKNRILFIGDVIPDSLAKDKIDKQVYLGSPMDIITHLKSLTTDNK